jgi:hypothetical protein
MGKWNKLSTQLKDTDRFMSGKVLHSNHCGIDNLRQPFCVVVLTFIITCELMEASCGTKLNTKIFGMSSHNRKNSLNRIAEAKRERKKVAVNYMITTQLKTHFENVKTGL